MTENYTPIESIVPYQTALKLSNDCWNIYEKLSWQIKKVVGDQFITAIDSVGANIAEGYGRFHYLDRIKFYYNSRGSLLEAKHWALLLKERQIISKEEYENVILLLNNLHRELNVYIKACYASKKSTINNI